jgi:hypothetical protein
VPGTAGRSDCWEFGIDGPGDKAFCCGEVALGVERIAGLSSVCDCREDGFCSGDFGSSVVGTGRTEIEGDSELGTTGIGNSLQTIWNTVRYYSSVCG